MLLSAVIFGGSFSDGRSFPAYASRALIGNTLERTGLAPLTDRFVDQVLGPGATSSNPKLAPVGSRGRDVFGGVDDALGEVVDHAFTNDDQAHAYEVTRLPFTGRTSTADADREPGEPECGTQLGGTVWYRYKATRNEALLADTFGTGYQTSLAAYRQSSAGPVALDNACDFDAQGNSQIKLDVIPGTTYLFQIAAAVRGGALTFHLKRFGSTILASVSARGEPGNAPSIESSVSFDGRYVAFASQATNLLGGMYSGSVTNTCIACYNVFLRDTKSGTTSLVSAGLDGRGGNNNSNRPQVSDDGRYVSFDSQASNLVSGDSNNVSDIFLRDMRTGRTERVSLSERGEQLRPGPTYSLVNLFGNAGAFLSSLSGDGRYVAFMSTSPNLVQGDGDEAFDVFVRDRLNGTTRLVSADAGASDVWLESISRNGRWIVLRSDVPMGERDEDLSQDVFVRDLWTGQTELVSVSEPGHELEGLRDAADAYTNNGRPISDDGRFVVFGSDGALVDGDTNNVLDVFVRDRLRQTTERVSVSSSGGQGTGASTTDPINSGSGFNDWSISADGRVVAFSTNLNGLEPSDGNGENDAYVHYRDPGVTLRISTSDEVGGGFPPSAVASAPVGGGFAPSISGDGMYTTFHGSYPLSYRDTNAFNDVFVFSPLAFTEQTGPVLRVAPKGSVPTAPCAASSEYTRVGVAGSHEDVTPSPFEGIETVVTHDGRRYDERSVVRFKYRIDVSHSSAATSARTADVRIALSWDYAGDINPSGLSDFDLYVYDANDELLAYSFTDNTTGSGEVVQVSQVPHCSDLRVDIVNNQGLPPDNMALDTTLRNLE